MIQLKNEFVNQEMYNLSQYTLYPLGLLGNNKVRITRVNCTLVMSHHRQSLFCE